MALCRGLDKEIFEVYTKHRVEMFCRSSLSVTSYLLGNTIQQKIWQRELERKSHDMGRRSIGFVGCWCFKSWKQGCICST
jgi:hypothetical protein